MNVANETLVVVLAGGKGTRISHLLEGIPKPLAFVSGKPFLFWVLMFLRKQGFKNIAISTGYLSDKIEEYISKLNLSDCNISSISEPEQLGTAGAVFNLIRNVNLDDFDKVLVINGDSLALFELLNMFSPIERCEVVIAGIRVNDASRYGSLAVDENSNLTAFAEKKSGDGLINAGIYLFKKAVITEYRWLGGALSMEFDFIPWLLEKHRKICVLQTNCSFLDIGTEESLKMADAFIGENISNWV
jgi:NDP-sugar pyrophosphorylase family protein